MGYRSDVCIAMTDSATRLMKAIISHLPESHEVHQLLEEDGANFKDITADHIANKDCDCDSKMYFEYVKWYERNRMTSSRQGATGIQMSTFRGV